MSSTDVKKFWDQRAVEHGADQVATHKDIHQRELEIGKIKAYLRPEDRVLDIGCGNGYSTRIFASAVREIVGMDYSEEMIAEANAQPRSPNCAFVHSNVLKLDQRAAGLFDAAITERCLINLASWEEQCAALRNIYGVLKPGGRLIFCEGSAEGRRNLNQARSALGLSVMPTVWHNIDFEREKTLKFMSEMFDPEEEISFGIYDLIARIVHPLLVAPADPAYDAKINAIAKDINLRMQGVHELSRVLFVVWRKR